MGEGRSAHTLRRLFSGATVLAPLVGVLAMANPAFADSPSGQPLQPGRWSVGLSADPWSGARTGALSVRRQMSARSALRLELVVDLHGNQSDASRNHSGWNEEHEDDEITGDRGGFTLIPTYVFYPRPGGRTVAVLAAGPFVGFQDRNETSSRTVNDGGLEWLTMRRLEEDQWTVGALTKVGMEWFFARRLSLRADCGITGQYRHFVSRDVQEWQLTGNPRTRVEIAERKQHRIFFNTTQLGLGLSFFF